MTKITKIGLYILSLGAFFVVIKSAHDYMSSVDFMLGEEPKFNERNQTIDVGILVSYSKDEWAEEVIWDYDITKYNKKTTIDIHLYGCRCYAESSHIARTRCETDPNGMVIISVPYCPHENEEVKLVIDGYTVGIVGTARDGND